MIIFYGMEFMPAVVIYNMASDNFLTRPSVRVILWIPTTETVPE